MDLTLSHTPINAALFYLADSKAEGLAALIVDVRKNFHKPLSKELDQLMTAFLDWFNNSSQPIPGVIRAGIAHLWFEVIHPFDDGNGRIGRAIIEYALAQDLGAPVVLSMSTHIEKNKKDYYQHLNQASCCDADELNNKGALAKCAKATATRDLGDLVSKDCLSIEGIGRGIRYFIKLGTLQRSI